MGSVTTLKAKAFGMQLSSRKLLRASSLLMAFLLLGFAFLNMMNVLKAFATTFANRPLGAVVNEAPTIVRGKVLNSYTDWGKGAQQRTIFTYTELEVTEALKGSVSDRRILMRQPGGEKDGIELSVPGSARFSAGSDVVVTIGAKDASDSAFDVLNLTAGKYDVVQENGEPVLVNSLGGAEVYDPTHKGSHEGSYTSRIALSDFKKIIQGQDEERAKQNQFAQQPAGANQSVSRPGGASRDSSPAIAVKSSGEQSPAAPVVESTPTSSVEVADGKNSWAIGLGIFFLLSVGALTWFAFGGGRNGKS